VRAFLDGKVTLHVGDCLDVIRAMPDASVDSCVTDPPYALVSIVKRFGSATAAPAKSEGASGVYKRASAGFMGKQWDTGERAFSVEFWQEVYRVLKPGGHVLAFAGTRTYHRLACAIEDVGFEVRDQIGWAFGSGFPKSHNVAKGVDRIMGAEPVVLSEGATVRRIRPGADQHKDGSWEKLEGRTYTHTVTAAGSDEARAWQGWGTALKPAWEPICVARKPIEGTVAANVLKHGVGALNIDGCRVNPGEMVPGGGNGVAHRGGIMGQQIADGRERVEPHTLGRWPANIVHDGSDEVVGAFPETSSGVPTAGDRNGGVYGEFAARSLTNHGASSGSAARFFYSAKADANDRLGSKHPTVKPVDLMQWLVRLVTPKGGLVLDPFAGTGTTGEAAFREGCRAILIEREAEYVADIERRMGLVLGGPDERRHAIIKAKGQTEHAGPLFGSLEAAE
jgi:DNA modification methylase